MISRTLCTIRRGGQSLLIVSRGLSNARRRWPPTAAFVDRNEATQACQLNEAVVSWVLADPTAFGEGSDGYLDALQIIDRTKQWIASLDCDDTRVSIGSRDRGQLANTLYHALDAEQSRLPKRVKVTTIGDIPRPSGRRERVWRITRAGDPDPHGSQLIEKLARERKAARADRARQQLELTGNMTTAKEVPRSDGMRTAPADVALNADDILCRVPVASMFAELRVTSMAGSGAFPKMSWGRNASRLFERTIAAGQRPNFFEGLALEALSRLQPPGFRYIKCDVELRGDADLLLRWGLGNVHVGVDVFQVLGAYEPKTRTFAAPGPMQVEAILSKKTAKALDVGVRRRWRPCLFAWVHDARTVCHVRQWHDNCGSKNAPTLIVACTDLPMKPPALPPPLQPAKAKRT